MSEPGIPILKCVLLGDRGPGKAFFLKSLQKDQFSQSSYPWIFEKPFSMLNGEIYNVAVHSNKGPIIFHLCYIKNTLKVLDDSGNKFLNQFNCAINLVACQDNNCEPVSDCNHLLQLSSKNLPIPFVECLLQFSLIKKHDEKEQRLYLDYISTSKYGFEMFLNDGQSFNINCGPNNKVTCGYVFDNILLWFAKELLRHPNLKFTSDPTFVPSFAPWVNLGKGKSERCQEEMKSCGNTRSVDGSRKRIPYKKKICKCPKGVRLCSLCDFVTYQQ